MCEHCVDPHNTEHTGAKDHNNRWYHTFPDPSGSCNGAVHKGTDAVGECHDSYPFHSCVNNRLLCGKKRKEFLSEYKQQDTQNKSCGKGIKQTDQIAVQHTFFIACAPVLADKTGTACIKGSHLSVSEGGVQ